MIVGQIIKYALVGGRSDVYYRAKINFVPEDWQWVELEITGNYGPKRRRFPLSSFLWWEDDDG